MKKVIGSVVSLTALVLLSYYGTGFLTEHTIKKNLSLLDQSNGLSAQVTMYKRGLFTSQVNLTWKMLTPERFVSNAADQVTILPSKSYTFEMPVTIYHGPVMYVGKKILFGLGYANSTFDFPDTYKADFMKDFTTESVVPKLDLSFFVTYANKMLLHIDVPAFRLISKEDNSQFQWLGMKSEHTFSSNMNVVEGDIVIDGARLSQADHVASLSKLTSTYDIHLASSGLFLGDVTVNVPMFEILFKSQKILDVQGFQMTSSSDVEEGLFGSSFHAAFEKALTYEKNYGPGRLSFAIKNLDADTLVEMNKKINDARNGSDAARQQAGLAILPDMPKLFGKGATIDISELNVVGPDGEIDGSVHIALPKMDEGNAFQLMQKIGGEGKLKLPEVLLMALLTRSERIKLSEQQAMQQAQNTMDASAESATKEGMPVASSSITETSSAPTDKAPTVSTQSTSAETINTQAEQMAKSRIERLVSSGAIVKKDTYYVIDIKLAAGQFSVNGRPLTAEMLQF